jgi:hypothetical protein
VVNIRRWSDNSVLWPRTCYGCPYSLYTGYPTDSSGESDARECVFKTRHYVENPRGTVILEAHSMATVYFPC